jgi:hypothetical protein
MRNSEMLTPCAYCAESPVILVDFSEAMGVKQTVDPPRLKKGGFFPFSPHVGRVMAQARGRCCCPSEAIQRKGTLSCCFTLEWLKTTPN